MGNDESFWDFSVRTYRRAGVADACLALQDRFGLDVNVLLYCCWLGCTRGPMDGGSFDAAIGFSEPWANRVVRPLRQIRTWMKKTGCVEPPISTAECMDLREKVKAVEFAAEHLQQDTLEALAPAPADRSLDPGARLSGTAGNLRLYLRHCEVRLDGTGQSQLVHIVAAAVDGIRKESVVKILAEVQET